MTVFVLSLFTGIIFCSCGKGDGNSVHDILKKSPVPEEWTVAFDQTSHDFGTIKESEGPATITFNFVNRSDSALVVSNVRASCGCTTPEWSKEPIAPGQKGFIKVTYDSKNRIGIFNKTITVTSNGNPDNIVLVIKGTVVDE